MKIINKTENLELALVEYIKKYYGDGEIFIEIISQSFMKGYKSGKLVVEGRTYGQKKGIEFTPIASKNIVSQKTR